MRLIGRSLLAAVLASLPACGSVANPRSCIDGTCTSDEFPFCDVDGAFGADPNTCIAVTCEPGVFAQCRDDVAVTCNASGTDYDLVSCPLGCQDGVGCRACQPNETVCANGAVQTCGASGEVVSNTTCSALGCFESEPRCRRIDASNGLTAYMDQVAAPNDLDLDNVVIDTFTRTITKNGVAMTGVDAFLVDAQPNGAPIFVVVARNVVMGNVQVRAENTGYQMANGAALAIVATGSIRVVGPVVVAPGTGGAYVAACMGGQTSNVADPDVDPVYGGNGGGGHATAGARGGDVSNRTLGGAGGGIVGTESLIPLRGGCGGSRGGGAVQLSSDLDIEIDGVVDVRGETPQGYHAGGGAGGALLIEAPRVKLGPNAKLLLLGGAGGAGDSGVLTTQLLDGSPMIGSTCLSGFRCGRGGNGASAGIPPTAGENTLNYGQAGGGGGGLGRIRVNTPTQSYQKSSSSIEAGVLTTGVLATR